LLPRPTLRRQPTPRRSTKCIVFRFLNGDSQVVCHIRTALGALVLLWGHPGGALVTVRGCDINFLRLRHLWCNCGGYCLTLCVLHLVLSPARVRVARGLSGVVASWVAPPLRLRGAAGNALFFGLLFLPNLTSVWV